jgi:arylsulfatase A-like enzyme
VIKSDFPSSAVSCQIQPSESDTEFLSAEFCFLRFGTYQGLTAIYLVEYRLLIDMLFFHLYSRIIICCCLIATFLIVASEYFFNTPEQKKEQHQNVVLIVVDTLRADHLGCYGYHQNTSPHIDAFAEESVLFENAIATSSWTTPSIGSILTSHYPSQFGIVGQKDLIRRLPDRFLTLAEIFRANGYFTGGIISSDIISSRLNFNQGFDIYSETNSKGRLHISSPAITTEAVNLIRENRYNKFFLFLHYFDPHFAYTMHSDFNYDSEYSGRLSSPVERLTVAEQRHSFSKDDAQFFRSAYNSEISLVDQYIGNLFKVLNDYGLYDDTLIVFTADHGEMLLEKENKFAHGTWLYQEIAHVPLIIKLPGSSAKKRISEFAGLIDLMPTILKYSGVSYPDDYRFEGQPIDISNPGALNRRPVYSEANTSGINKLRVVIKDGWKLILDRLHQQKELYNLNQDPRETVNLSDTNPDSLSKLNHLLQLWIEYTDSCRKTLQSSPSTLNEKQLKNLQSMGYL